MREKLSECASKAKNKFKLKNSEVKGKLNEAKEYNDNLENQIVNLNKEMRDLNFKNEKQNEEFQKKFYEKIQNYETQIQEIKLKNQEKMVLNLLIIFFF